MSMTLDQAFAYTARQGESESRGPLNHGERIEWKEAEKTIVDAGFCFYCSLDGRRERLGEQHPGNQEEYAGRECTCCEEFAVCGDQPGYETADCECVSDGDPGL